LVRSDRELPFWIAPAFPFVAVDAAGWFCVPPVRTQVELEITVSAPGDQTRGEATLTAHNARYRAGLYTARQQVPAEFRESYPNRRGIKTPGGTIFMFDDTADDEHSLWQDKFGNVVLLTESGLKFYNSLGSFFEIRKDATGTTVEANSVFKVRLDGDVKLARDGDPVSIGGAGAAWAAAVTAGLNAILGPGTIPAPPATDWGVVIATTTKLFGGG
jgi:hypothetical protein